MATRRVAIFAHHDHHGQVKAYVLHHLRALRAVTQAVHFVSTAELPGAELDKARALCASATTRPNAGFDFGMWQSALASLELSDIDELVLTNSSVFGPLWPLAQLFERMAAVPCDFWGMTENLEISWHIQSYFLVARSRALNSEAWRQFWHGVLPYRDKAQVVRSYEVGFSKFLVEAGLTPAVMVPIDTLAGRRGRKGRQRRNPTTFQPLRLLEHGMPYVKAELLRDNPGAVARAPVYRAMRAAGYDPALIEFDRPGKPSRWQRAFAALRGR